MEHFLILFQSGSNSAKTAPSEPEHVTKQWRKKGPFSLQRHYDKQSLGWQDGGGWAIRNMATGVVFNSGKVEVHFS